MRMMTVIAMLAVVGSAAQAQDHATGSAHGAQDHSMGGTQGDAYDAAMARMMEGMDIERSGDPDIDFARGMIPHHQGAIEMAQVVLDEGSDPELRALAEAIIAAQEAEIAFLRAWIEANDRP